MEGSYSILLITFSVFIAFIVSYITFDLYLRFLVNKHAPEMLQRVWLISGSVILGVGIWYTQFIGILAYHPTNNVYLDLVYIVFSFLISVIGSYLFLYLFGKKRPFIGSTIFGSTICFLYFIGSEALHGNGSLHFNISMYFMALLVGSIGIYFPFQWVNVLKRISIHPSIIKLLAGACLGVSITVTRLIVKMGTSLTLEGKAHVYDVNNHMPILAAGVGIIIIILLILVFFGSHIIDNLIHQSVKVAINEQYYQSLYEHNPDMIITFDLKGNFLSINRVVEKYGFTKKEIIHQSFVSLVAPDQLDKTVKYFEKAKSGQHVKYESAFYGKNGERFEVKTSNFPIIVNDKIVGVYAILKNITELKKAQATLAEAEDKYRSLTDNSVIGSYITQDGKFVYANQKLLEMLGYSKEELLGSNVMDYIYADDRQLIYEKVKERMNDISATAHYQYRMVKKDKSIIYVETFGSAMLYKTRPAAIGTIVDITARKKAEETIEYMAYHDSLTGLINRNAFSRRLNGILQKETTMSLALVYIDLDEFKLIDNALGHVIGDQLLKAVSERLVGCVPFQGEIGRNRGDEFLIAIPNATKKDAAIVAERMITGFSEPFSIDHYELFVTPSIGISLYPNDAETQEDLIKKAESAMTQTKKGGKNDYQFYNPSQLELSHERLELEMSLRKALEREEFQLHYQPKFDLTSGKMKSVEALIRWQHPTKGFISPGEFIPLAEDMGLIIPIGEWVLKTACVQAKTWQDAGYAPFEVSVNLSVRQIYQPDLVETVERILKETGLEPKYLELEITESMMVDSDHALDVLNELKSLGLKISLDDFGTGYSSLHYLKEAPIDKLKIDQSFIQNCAVDINDATLVKTIIAMAHQLGLEVIAEGVETFGHLIFLQQNLCDEAQGYLFSKPVPPAELIRKLEELEKIVHHYGIPKNLQGREWKEKALEFARQEVLDTIRQQQGMIFKFIEEDGRFIHTLCDGELTYQMGLVPEQIIGRELKDFLSIEEAERKTGYYRRAFEGEMNVSYEGEMNGIFYTASLRPIKRGGEVICVIGSCVDISKRKQIEEALRLSETNYRLIADNTQDMIEVWDPTGFVKYASPSHEKVLGHPTNSFKDRSVIGLVHPEDRSNLEYHFNKCIVNNEFFKVEFRCKNASGNWVYIEAQGTPVLGEDNKVQQVVVVGRDVTDKKAELKH